MRLARLKRHAFPVFSREALFFRGAYIITEEVQPQGPVVSASRREDFPSSIREEDTGALANNEVECNGLYALEDVKKLE
jgi:hypothetical protein